MRKTIYPFVIFCLAGLFSCTSSTQLQVLQPAQVVLPDHVEVIVTADRSKPAKGFINVVEGLFTGEDIGQDRRGRIRALDGLTSTLTRTPRYSVKTSGIEMTGSSTGNSIEPPLPWDDVERICKQFGADALLTIEMYDSDNFITTGSRTEKKKDKDGKQYTEKYYVADMRTQVRIGWRVYDPKDHRILDEYTTMDDASSDARGNTEDAARRNLPAREGITQTVSQAAGELYGMRIAPVWINVTRNWYTKGKGSSKADMERAARLARAGNWEQATDIWNGLVNGAADEKTRGRAAYNMAVAYERAGKLSLALEWAQAAYTDYGNKNARSYIDNLRLRIYEQQRVEEQMKGRE
ncbi:MAG: hypothetical protein KDC66_23740 [Phaeodactylibacter sp.]|nr:hypothetical protein [Phaeodactylibacter sp.]MCB9276842.1 hypothetical protein [Lewinellaceae bacterium]